MFYAVSLTCVYGNKVKYITHKKALTSKDLGRSFFHCNKIMQNISFWIPLWLDTFLIAPFRWPNDAQTGFWLGCALLALYCVIIGKIIYALLQRIHGKYYNNMQNDMQQYHKASINALHAGNKEAYFAVNTLAHDSFGKHFFARASISMASLMPLPFALAWLSLRFEGLELYSIPYTSLSMGYVFVFLVCYITLRLSWASIQKNS